MVSALQKKVPGVTLYVVCGFKGTYAGFTGKFQVVKAEVGGVAGAD